MLYLECILIWRCRLHVVGICRYRRKQRIYRGSCFKVAGIWMYLRQACFLLPCTKLVIFRGAGSKLWVFGFAGGKLWVPGCTGGKQ